MRLLTDHPQRCDASKTDYAVRWHRNGYSYAIIMLLIHKERTDKLYLIDTTNMFCEKNDERQRVFGVSYKRRLKVVIGLTLSDMFYPIRSKITEFFYVKIPVFTKSSLHAIRLACLWKIGNFIWPYIFGSNQKVVFLITKKSLWNTTVK